MVGESGSGAIENLLFSSWVTTFKTCYFLVNICLVLIDFLTKEVFFIQKEFAKLGAQGSLWLPFGLKEEVSKELCSEWPCVTENLKWPCAPRNLRWPRATENLKWPRATENLKWPCATVNLRWLLQLLRKTFTFWKWKHISKNNLILKMNACLLKSEKWLLLCHREFEMTVRHRKFEMTVCHR